jgi:hypothetical protein
MKTYILLIISFAWIVLLFIYFSEEIMIIIKASYVLASLQFSACGKSQLSDIAPAGIIQGDLFADQVLLPNSAKLMSTLDQINLKMGKGALNLASQGIGQGWKMKRGNMSPAYTTKWNELPEVR